MKTLTQLLDAAPSTKARSEALAAYSDTANSGTSTMVALDAAAEVVGRALFSAGHSHAKVARAVGRVADRL